MSAPGEVVLLLAGDVFPGGVPVRISDAILRLRGPEALAVVNLEGPITDRDVPATDRPGHLRTPPDHAGILDDLSPDVAVLANNHILDMGAAGFEDTLTFLERRGIVPLGAGRCDEEARRPIVLERGGLRVGLLAASSEEIGTFRCSDGGPGCAILEDGDLEDRVRELAGSVDALVVSVHWGQTNFHLPLPRHRELGRRLVRAGATVVMGHHPHVMQGFERVGSGVVLYSLGNLCFSRYLRHGRLTSLSGENRAGMLARIVVTTEGVSSVGFHHTRFDETTGVIDELTGRLAARRDRALKRLSRPLGGEDYERAYRRYEALRLVRRALEWSKPSNWSQLTGEKLGAGLESLRRVVGLGGAGSSRS